MAGVALMVVTGSAAQPELTARVVGVAVVGGTQL